MKLFSILATLVLVVAAMVGVSHAQSMAGVPAFTDNFSSGSMDSSKWTVNVYNPGIANYAGAGATFTSTADHCDFSTGMLRIQLDQPTATTSHGCEFQSKQAFGYGTYVWNLRASSTSATPSGAGTTHSGSISTGFILSDANSATEIDSPEIEGQTPKIAEFTNWLNKANNGAASITTTFNPQDGFHNYGFTWTATSVTYFIDNVQVAQHLSTQTPNRIPQSSNPGFVLISHYGTNSSGFGGTATVGVTRYLYARSFSYYVTGTTACP